MKIGIIGASSQVGSSVALYLKHLYGVEAQCFIRSSYSNIFFRLFDIPVTPLDFNDRHMLTRSLNDIDVVVDCTYPAGQLFEIPALIYQTAESVISSMKPGTSYIYMSSIMAYGMPAGEKVLREYVVPRSSYAYIKRQAEKRIAKLCNRHSVHPYLFRLGQVHGFLQSVSGSFRDKLLSNPVFYIDGKENDLTNTIFISSVCESILRCAEMKQAPGLYTLVSSPQWTLQDLYGYYKEQYQIPSRLSFVPSSNNGKHNGVMSKLMSFVKDQRPLIESYVLMKSPSLSIKLKGRFRENETRAVMAAGTVTYPDFNLLGTPAHSSVAGVECRVPSVAAMERQIEDLYNSVIESASREF